MRRFHLILWAIPLAVALGGCTLGAGRLGGTGGGLFKPRATAAALSIAGTAAKPLDTSAIQTQTLAPAPAAGAQTGSAPARVIGAASTKSPAKSPTTQAQGAEAQPSTAQSAEEIGAAAAAALQQGVTATKPTTAAAAGNPVTPTPTPTATAAPTSPEEAACIKGGGRWGKAGDTGAMSCFHPAKDAGKSCRKESDCSSQCLARSRSCAPFWPIFGCSEVIQNDGAVVKLCLE